MAVGTHILTAIIVLVAILLPVLYILLSPQSEEGNVLEGQVELEHTKKTLTHPHEIDKPPHILFFILDDAGFNDVSWNNPEVYMPTLDKLAREGVILDQHYSQHICTPSRTAILTGMYPFHTGDQHTPIVPWAPTCSARFHHLLPEKLREVGYKNYAIGKWHMGHCHEACTPINRGFDSFAGYHNGQTDHFSLRSFGRLDWYNNLTVNRDDIGTYSTEIITKKSLEVIRNHDPQKPGFFFINYAAPHSPIQVPSKYVTRFRADLPEIRRNFLGMMYAIDESVRVIVQEMKEAAMWEKSVLVLLSDNGAEFVGVPLGGSNAPLRGAKLSLYEGGTRTPAFFYAPNLSNGGRSTNGLFHLTDWHATLLSLAGVRPDESLDGVDQTEMLYEDGPSHRDEMVYNLDAYDMCHFGQTAIRQGDYKLIVGSPGFVDGWEQDNTVGLSSLTNLLFPDTPPSKEARPPSNLLGMLNYQDILQSKGGQDYMMKLKNHAQLFNLKDDPEERYDIAEKHPAIVAKLKDRIAQLAKESIPVHPDFEKMDPASKFQEPTDVFDVSWCPPPW